MTTKGASGYADAKELAAERGLSVSVLARRSGLSRAFIWQLEKGDSSPTLRTLQKLSRGLGCPVSELMEEATRRNGGETTVKRTEVTA